MPDAVFIIGDRIDAEALFEIIRRRVDWMDENGIDQWNNHDYLSVFPIEYYLKKADEMKLCVCKEDGKVVCGAVLEESDKRWNDGEKAVYVHNFAADEGHPGTGRKMLEYIIALAKRRGCRFVRLDCDVENAKLNAYYESFGFYSLDGFTEGPYRGIKKQKEL